MTAWLSGRRAAATVDRFMAAADPAELTTFCPPGVTSPERRTSSAATPTCPPPSCPVYGRFRRRWAPVDSPTSRSSSAPTGPDTFESGTLLATGDAEVMSPDGRPIVLAGRLADPDAANEAIINTVVRDLGLRVGDRLTARSPAIDEAGLTSAFSGPELTLEIVGIVRTPSDLSATANGETPAVLAAGPGVWRSIEDRAWMGYTIAVQARDGDSPAARAAILAAFPDRGFDIASVFAPDDTEPVRGGLRVRRQGGLRVRGLGGRGRDHLRRAGGDPPGATRVGRSPPPSEPSGSAGGRPAPRRPCVAWSSRFQPAPSQPG